MNTLLFALSVGAADPVPAPAPVPHEELRVETVPCEMAHLTVRWSPARPATATLADDHRREVRRANDAVTFHRSQGGWNESCSDPFHGLELTVEVDGCDPHTQRLGGVLGPTSDGSAELRVEVPCGETGEAPAPPPADPPEPEGAQPRE
ncbi:MAG: hypothetical protein ACI8PZ_007065 [Myxococcota bacterium]|jgi:hypothetical protein